MYKHARGLNLDKSPDDPNERRKMLIKEDPGEALYAHHVYLYLRFGIVPKDWRNDDDIPF